MEIPWHRFACPWRHACDILRWNKGLRCWAFVFMYSILWKVFFYFKFLFNNLRTGYLQIMFHIDEAKQRLPWTATITFDHVKIFKLTFSARSSKSNTEQCAWPGGICGCLSFYWKISWFIVHQIGSLLSNMLHHIVSEYAEKWGKSVEFDTYIGLCSFFFIYVFFNSRYIQFSGAPIFC